MAPHPQAPAQVRDLMADGKARLRSAPHSPPGREVHLLLSHVLGWSEGELLARDDTFVTDGQQRAFLELLERRLQGEPVAYLTGRREFFGRSFFVDDRVLIPRPETEHLVEAALDLLPPSEATLLDIGTGSGCLGITLALESPGGRVVATDRSLAALAVTRRNARELGAADRVHTLNTDWAVGLALDSIDLVVSNPPYIADGEAAELSCEITDFEPEMALWAGREGLDAYAAIYSGLRDMRPGTPILAEVGRGQAQPVAVLATEHGFTVRQVIKDYAGIERVVVVIR